MTALDRKLFRDLRHIWMQALAIALVIGCGVAMYIMSLGMLHSLEETRAAYYDRYRFADVFAAAKRAPEGLKRQIADIPGVALVETRVVAGATLDIADMDEPARGVLVSIPDHGPPLLNALHIREGRSVAAGRPGEAVLDEAFAHAHGLHPGDHLAAVINGRKRALTVVGIALSPEYVYTLGPGAIVPDNRRYGVIWVGHSMLASAFDLEGAFNSVSLTLLRDASEAAVIAELDRLLAPYGGQGAYGRKDQLSHWFVSNELTQLRNMANIISPIFLGVAAFLLHIVLSRLVTTEREQIGLLKAFGYSNTAIGWHYAKLVLAIIAVGILLGYGAGAWLGRGLAEMYTEFFHFPFLYYRPNPGVFAMTAVVSVVIGLSGALGAVRRAAKLPPAVAMQPPAPPAYGVSRIERLGLRLRLAQTMRMVIRQILRRAGRSAVTMLGISLAAALLVSSMYMLDTIDFMLDVQFNMISRQDLTVTLVDPKPASILADFRAMPGVMRAEAERVASVRLRKGNLSRRTGLIGLSPGADLSRTLDIGLQPIDPPPLGIALSRSLAEVLGAGPGDRVTVEALEGRRPVAAIPVTAVVEQFLGSSAFMARGTLNSLMEEGDLVSVVNLQVDASRQSALYRALKDAPAVAGVTVEEAALQSFRDTLAENMMIMTTFNIIFSSLIAFGVVYNSARISLSERGHELATLRVLGFTRAEVSWILLGEFAAITLAALPPGLLIGYGLASFMSVMFETELFRFPVVIDRSTYGFSALVVAGAAMATGLVVRSRIDRLDLVAVLKTRE